jgi:NADH-quinone oxidoreductase subunit N
MIVSVLVASLCVLLGAAWKRHHVLPFAISLVGLLVAIALAADFASALILLSAIAVLWLSKETMCHSDEVHEEYYASLLLSVGGALTLIASQDVVTFFVGLELMTIPLYGLIVYFHARENSLEASVKYLTLAGVSVAFLLFGLALIYSQVGSLQFSSMAVDELSPVWILGGLFVIVGLGFKLSLVPFHFWTPDVYQGAPLPITAYLTTVSKAAVAIFFLRFLTLFGSEAMFSVLAVMAIASMLVGNWLALRQNHLRRLLAYSSIAHMGYVLVALVGLSEIRSDAVHFYLLAYAAASLLAFSVLQILEAEGRFTIDQCRGLLSDRPLLASSLALALLSLMGLPLTAGFMGKFRILFSAVDSGQWGLIAALVVSSGIGVYVYMRVLVTMFQNAESTWVQKKSARDSQALVFVLAAATIFLGVWPLAV